MLKICEHELCTGCGACMNGCPVDAISMVQNDKGFLYPVINNSCINCKKCQGICPQNNIRVIRKPKQVYAALARDDAIRNSSSSGGIFSVLANEVLKSGGHIFGAALMKNLKVQHIEIIRTEDLELLKGSKYVQSEIGKTYRMVKERLKERKMVLFSGTPCQIDGLHSYLGKDYENLLTVDILCHGVPSPAVFEKFCNAAEKNADSEIANIQFRKKIPGWVRWQFQIEYENGETEFYSQNNSFPLGFFKNLYLRESCYQCRYACANRTGDITLGDYWGYKESKPEYIEDDDRGISLVILNTEKGERFWRKIRRKTAYAQRTVDDAGRRNPNLRMPNEKPTQYGEFWQDFPTFTWEELSDKYFPYNGEEIDKMSKEDREYYAIPYTKRHPRHVIHMAKMWVINRVRRLK